MAKKETIRTYDDLLLEIEELKSRLSESEDALNAIRNGEVDAIVVSGSDGEKIFSLTTAETPYRVLLEEMNEGAMTINSNGNVLYCNQKFADLLSIPVSQIIGSNLINVITNDEKEKFRKLVKKAYQSQTNDLFSFSTETNASLRHLQLSFRRLPAGFTGEISIIASDVTTMKQYQEHLEELVKERTLEIAKINDKLRNDLIELEKARVSLSESEQKYRTTLNSIADAVIATDVNGFVTYMNPLAEQITGWMFNEAKNKPVAKIFDVIDENTREEIENPVEQALEKGVIYVGLTNHTLLIRKDRSEIVIADSAAVIKDNDGNIRGVVLVFRDMTQSRSREDLLRQSEKKYREIVETSAEGIIQSTPDGKIVFANKKMAEMLGYELAELIGKSVSDLRFDDFEQSTIQQIRTELRKGADIHGDFKFRHKNGSVLWTTYNASPLFNEHGVHTGNLIMHTDKTNQKIAEDILKETQKKLTLALENGNIGIWEWNLQTDEITFDGRARNILELQPGSRVDNFKAFEALLHDEDIDHVMKAFNRAINDDIPLETIFRLKSGNTFISSKGSTVRNYNGSPIFMSGVCYDISGLKKSTDQTLLKLSKELLRSNKELENFAYVASHDLQEPLRMVTSFTQLLQKQYGDKLDESANEYIHFAVDGSKRMYELLNGLLAYSRIHTKGKVFTMVDLNKVIDSVMNNLSMRITEREAVIKTDDMPMVYADESQMILLFQNLISNSIKFSTNPPRIFISSKAEGDNYSFYVRDEGIGIEPQYFEKIFLIFQRLLPRDHYEGTGIGLSICKRIIERHEGKIWLESELGKGTTFIFSIPKQQTVN